MFESEVNGRAERLETVPEDVVTQLSEYRKQVLARTVLPWGEHCTECVWPSCYTSCELYEPRVDGACRQFVGGVTRIPTPDGTVPYLQKITFRRWAKLWTSATVQCHPLETADRWERLNLLVGTAARNLPAPREIKTKVLRKVSYIRRQKLTAKDGETSAKPDYFVTEIYNPSDREVSLTLTIRGGTVPLEPAFQRLLRAMPGLTREKVPFEQIGGVVEADEGLQIELVPNDAENVTLYFGLLDFVQERVKQGQTPASSNETRKCKCVVWDLDNTLWHGVLIEDGVEGIRLREGAMDLVRELDRRGILQSVASKNNPDDALAALKHFGVDEYFLYPQASWSPKSQSIANIAKTLNIDLDTFVFVDDQEFERQEVLTALPQIRVVDPIHLAAMAEWEPFQVPITEESSKRRLMYRQQEMRAALLTSYDGDYVGFLKANAMRVRLSHLQEANIQRVYELAQRTNQMNFSGSRYTLEELRSVEQNSSLETHVLRCEDRFGTYGIVGFAVVNCEEPRLLDLMFSCRVQAKRVEHEFLAWLVRQHRNRQHRDFFANYRKTPRNEPGGAVFRELGFEEIGIQDGVTSLRFSHVKEVPHESIVEIELEELSS